MSRVYEALRQMQKEQGEPGKSPFPQGAEFLDKSTNLPTQLEDVVSVRVKSSPSARLVALSDPRSLGAEKFRALAARLDNLRRQKEMKSLQVTSGGINEGKSLVSRNLAMTFASNSPSKVLLLEGDLYRPNLASMFGLGDLRGLSDWWSQQEQDITRYLYRLEEMFLWILPAGTEHEQPSQLLQSSRFVEAFHQLTGWFDWIIVDSTPMLPIAAVNLWSRLVDGTLLVVREGIASSKALQKGLHSADNLKLVGIVLNDASEHHEAGYENYYYGVGREVKPKNEKIKQG